MPLVLGTFFKGSTENRALTALRTAYYSSMKTQYYTAATLDGFIAGPGDSLDWLFAIGDPEESTYPDFIKDVGALAMGSSTYEWVVRHLTGSGKGEPWPYTQPTWVFTSRSLGAAPGPDIRFVHGDVRPVHAEMVAAAGGKNVWVVGGAGWARDGRGDQRF